MDHGVPVERSILVSGLPRDASEREIISYFGRRKNGGVQKILRDEKNESVLVVFVNREDALSVLRGNVQYFRDTFHLTIDPVPVKEKPNDLQAVDVFESVSGLLNPNLFVGLTQEELTLMIENVTKSTSIQLVPSGMGLLVVGGITELEMVKEFFGKELEQVRKRNDGGYTTQEKRLPFNDQQKLPSKYSGFVKEQKPDTTTFTMKERTSSELNKLPTTSEAHDAQKQKSVRSFPKYKTRDRPETMPAVNSLHSKQRMKIFEEDIYTSSQTSIPRRNEEIGDNHFFLNHESNKQHRNGYGDGDLRENGRSIFNETKNANDVTMSLPNMVAVRILQGNLTNHVQADVIVNPGNGSLQNISGIGALIVDLGGLLIQSEINDQLGCRDTFPPGTIITTTAGSLPFKNIFHIVCPERQQERISSKILYDMCLKCLVQLAETGMNTIAFPSLSSRYFPISEDICAQVMLDAVVQFANKRTRTKPINIDFVIDNNNTCRTFQTELDKLVEKLSKYAGQKIPRINEKVPRNNEKVPRNNEKLPRNNEKLSRNYETLPRNNEKLPRNNEKVPRNNEKLPRNNEKLPRNNEKLTRNNEKLTRNIQKSPKIKEEEKCINSTNEDNKCPVCLDTIHNPKTLEKCQHTFCKACLDHAFKVKKICPFCKMAYITSGNQPNGKMSFTKQASTLPGYEECGTIVVTYSFKGGIQGVKHPNPGQRYEGATRIAFLPDNRDGNEVFSLLKIAFDNRLIFRIGTRGNPMSNQISWGDIDHKTSKTGGHLNYGYPDQDYLMRVKEQLADKGIYP